MVVRRYFCIWHQNIYRLLAHLFFIFFTCKVIPKISSLSLYWAQAFLSQVYQKGDISMSSSMMMQNSSSGFGYHESNQATRSPWFFSKIRPRTSPRPSGNVKLLAWLIKRMGKNFVFLSFFHDNKMIENMKTLTVSVTVTPTSYLTQSW